MNLELTKIRLNRDNRMLRMGFGKHKGHWFFRVDLWSVAYRVTKARPHKDSALLYVVRRPVASPYMVDIPNILVAQIRPEWEGRTPPHFLFQYMQHTVGPVRLLVCREESLLQETLAFFKDTIEQFYDFRFQNWPLIRVEDMRPQDIIAVDDALRAWNLKAYQIVDVPSA